MVGGQSPDKFMTTSGGGESTWVTSLALLLSIGGTLKYSNASVAFSGADTVSDFSNA